VLRQQFKEPLLAAVGDDLTWDLADHDGAFRLIEGGR
jgi:hypothetical protein